MTFRSNLEAKWKSGDWWPDAVAFLSLVAIVAMIVSNV